MFRAKERGLDRHTTWTGLITDPFAEGAYDGADIVCQVSRWQEAFGQTIAEAMACGKPVIGTRVGGIPELIDDGHSGFLVDRGDVRGIAAKLLLLLADDAVAKRMGQAGHELARQKFQLRENVAEVLKLYEISPSVSYG
jgi:glycosyltransferase involved in cell wall biosynthesis